MKKQEEIPEIGIIFLWKEVVQSVPFSRFHNLVAFSIVTDVVEIIVPVYGYISYCVYYCL